MQKTTERTDSKIRSIAIRIANSEYKTIILKYNGGETLLHESLLFLYVLISMPNDQGLADPYPDHF